MKAITTSYFCPSASPNNPGEFASWPEAYETVKAKMALLASYDRTIRFVYVTPDGTPVAPPSSAVYEPFPLSGVYEAFSLDGAGVVPFTLEGRMDFPE